LYILVLIGVVLQNPVEAFSELGTCYLFDIKGFAVMSKILVEIKVIFVGIINKRQLFMPKSPLVIKRICILFSFSNPDVVGSS
jgi:hypothetical protein